MPLEGEGGFGTGYWAEAGGDWRLVLEKAYTAVNEAFRAILVTAQKERAREEASILLENT